MAIVLSVEDGSGKEDANCYVSISTARAYATNRGVTLPLNDDAVAAFIIKATDYIESQESRFQGVRSTPTQALSWPRSAVCLNGKPFPATAIPGQLIGASCQLVIAQNDGLELQGNITAEDYVTRETVGPITVEFADPISVGIAPKFTAADALLKPLFGDYSAFASAIRTIRV